MGSTQRTTVKNSLLLLLAACIWGVAFVAQSAGMEYVGPFTFNAARFLIGGTVLLPLVVWRNRGRSGRNEAGEKNGNGFAEKAENEAGRKNGLAAGQWKTTLFGGACCGLAIFCASTFQQVGIQYTTVGKAGFITTLYIVMVPVSGLFFGRRSVRSSGRESFWRRRDYICFA